MSLSPLSSLFRLSWNILETWLIQTACRSSVYFLVLTLTLVLLLFAPFGLSHLINLLVLTYDPNDVYSKDWNLGIQPVKSKVLTLVSKNGCSLKDPYSRYINLTINKTLIYLYLPDNKLTKLFTVCQFAFSNLPHISSHFCISWAGSLYDYQMQ